MRGEKVMIELATLFMLGATIILGIHWQYSGTTLAILQGW